MKPLFIRKHKGSFHQINFRDILCKSDQIANRKAKHGKGEHESSSSEKHPGTNFAFA
jgi:hypothetical protein